MKEQDGKAVKAGGFKWNHLRKGLGYLNGRVR